MIAISTSKLRFLRSLSGLAWGVALVTVGAAQPGGSADRASPQGRPRVVREIFISSPKPGDSVIASTFYTRPKGFDLLSVHEILRRSDTVEIAEFRYSSDNGRTWTEKGEEFPTFGVRPAGKLRRTMRGCVVDPNTGRLLNFYLEAILPTDDPLEGFKNWVVYYRVSENGGMTWYLNEQIVESGPEFNADHPLPGVRRGHTGMMIGDPSNRAIFLRDGTLLVPVIVAPAGPDGNYRNLGGGYTYSDAAVIRGRWAADGRHIEWKLSSLVKIDPARSTRGADEPTLAVLDDGRVLMVLRGSNDKKPHLPGRRWVAFSSDEGRTWMAPLPWTYSNGEDFYSPAASSQLFVHSSGRIFWFGNITPQNPTGNRPRYPMVMGEVNRKSGLLEKDSVVAIDDRAPNETTALQLSSPSAREDRETGEILLNLTRWSEFSKDDKHDWTAHAYLYHIRVD